MEENKETTEDLTNKDSNTKDIESSTVKAPAPEKVAGEKTVDYKSEFEKTQKLLEEANKNHEVEKSRITGSYKPVIEEVTTLKNFVTSLGSLVGAETQAPTEIAEKIKQEVVNGRRSELQLYKQERLESLNLDSASRKLMLLTLDSAGSKEAVDTQLVLAVEAYRELPKGGLNNLQSPPSTKPVVLNTKPDVDQWIIK